MLVPLSKRPAAAAMQSTVSAPPTHPLTHPPTHPHIHTHTMSAAHTHRMWHTQPCDTSCVLGRCQHRTITVLVLNLGPANQPRLPALPHLVMLLQDLLAYDAHVPSVCSIRLPAPTTLSCVLRSFLRFALCPQPSLLAPSHLVMLLQDLPEALLIEHKVVLSSDATAVAEGSGKKREYVRMQTVVSCSKAAALHQRVHTT